MQKVIDWLNVNSGAAMAALTLAYVLCTLALYRTSRRANSLAIDLHKATNRPMIIADIFMKWGYIYLRFRNVGRYAAHNLRISITDNPAPQIDQWNNYALNNLTSLVPASELIYFTRYGIDAGLPTVSVAITYDDPDGNSYADPPVITHLSSILACSRELETYDPVRHLGSIAGSLSRIADDLGKTQ